jgi:hypothetical protein
MSAGLSPSASATKRLRPSWQEGLPASRSITNPRLTPVAIASWAWRILSCFRRLRIAEPKAEAAAEALWASASIIFKPCSRPGTLSIKRQNSMKSLIGRLGMSPVAYNECQTGSIGVICACSGTTRLTNDTDDPATWVVCRVWSGPRRTKYVDSLMAPGRRGGRSRALIGGVGQDPPEIAPTAVSGRLLACQNFLWREEGGVPTFAKNRPTSRLACAITAAEPRNAKPSKSVVFS